MNYDVGKLISENENKPQNILVEQKINRLFPTNQLLTEASVWQRAQDSDGYWKILFDQLTKGGIGVKWQVANDPVKSTFMFWGPWVIWKDATKNGGWPVTFTDSSKKLWLFKFQGGKYAGQPATNIILESKFVNSTFNLGQWGKSDAKAITTSLSNLMKTKPKQTTNVQGCTYGGKAITAQQIPGVATKIFTELAYAFDGAGTYEKEAVDAYNMITCKPILDAVNAKVKARRMSGINNVGDWAKDEMSDYDFEQYRTIWNRLQKLGMQAPAVNRAMQAAGIVGDVVGVNALEKGAEGIQQLFTRPQQGFEKIVDAVQGFLGGVAGGVITTILDFTGIGKLATSVIYAIALILEAILAIWKGQPRWIYLIVNIISLATTGSVGVAISKVLKPLMGANKTLGAIVGYMSKSKVFSSVGKAISGGLSKIGSAIKSAIAWLVKKDWWIKYMQPTFGALLSKASAWITKTVDDFAMNLATKGGAGSTALTQKGTQYLQKQGADKIKEKIGKEAAEDLGWTAAGQVGFETGGETGSNVVALGKLQKGLASNQKDLSKSFKSVNTGRITPLTKTTTKMTKNLGAVSKDIIKTGEKTGKVVGGLTGGEEGEG